MIDTAEQQRAPVDGYREYLLRSLLEASEKFQRDFRKSEITENTAPRRFRVIEDAGRTFIDLVREIHEHETFEKGCISVIEKYLPDVKVHRPLNDGVDHVNIYSRGRTELGRILSNFTKAPFEHPIHGKFASVEAFWYFIKTGSLHYLELAHLHGFKVKTVGRKLEVVGHPEFEFEVETGIWCKVMQNPYVKSELKRSTLPFTHYYYYGDVENPAIRVVKNDILERTYEKIRKYLNRLPSDKIKRTLVILDEKFTDYKFMNDDTMGGMRFLIEDEDRQLIFVRSGEVKYSDSVLKLKEGEGLIKSATKEELFNLALDHDVIVYVGGRRSQKAEQIIATIEIVDQDVVCVGRF